MRGAPILTFLLALWGLEAKRIVVLQKSIVKEKVIKTSKVEGCIVDLDGTEYHVTVNKTKKFRVAGHPCFIWTCNGGKAHLEIDESGCPVGDRCEPVNTLSKAKCGKICTITILDDESQTFEYDYSVKGKGREVCMFEDDCFSVGESVQMGKNCTIMKCVSDDSAKGTLWKKTGQGCLDKKGECVSVNHKFRDSNCQWNICLERDGQIIPQSATDSPLGCLAPNDTCVDLGSTFMSAECVQYKCTEQDGKIGVWAVGGACLHSNGTCLPVGTTYMTEKCDVIHCQARVHNAGVWKGAGSCRANDGTCVKAGRQHRDSTCSIVECSLRENNFNVHVLKKGCKRNDTDECVDVGRRWMDEHCMVHECLPSGSWKNIGGCKDGKTCIKVGTSRRINKCLEYSCVETQDKIDLVLTDARCLTREGKCVNASAEMPGDKCQWFQCEKVGNIVKTSLLRTGCLGPDGECWDIGERFKGADCVWKKCKLIGKKGQIVSDGHGCVDKNGECHDINESFKGKDCHLMKCVERDGGGKLLEMGVCQDDKGNCVDVGSMFRSNNCSSAKCVSRHDRIYLEHIGNGCRHEDGSCVDEGGLYVDSKCHTYRCTRSADGTLQPSHVSSVCEHQGQCIGIDQTYVTAQCDTFKCEKSGRGAKATLLSSGCIIGDSCKSYDEEWIFNCSKIRCEKDEKERAAITVLKSFEGVCWDQDICYLKGETFMIVQPPVCKPYVCGDNGKVLLKGAYCLTSLGDCLEEELEKSTVFDAYYKKDGTPFKGINCTCVRKADDNVETHCVKAIKLESLPHILYRKKV